MTQAGCKTILLVEDDDALAAVLAVKLKSVGYEVHAERCGTTALIYAAERRPDLVVLDLRLPDMDGYEVCRRLRGLYNRWDVPIVMLTGRDRPIDELRGFAHGADAYLSKPCEPLELLNTIIVLTGETALR